MAEKKKKRLRHSAAQIDATVDFVMAFNLSVDMESGQLQMDDGQSN